MWLNRGVETQTRRNGNARQGETADRNWRPPRGIRLIALPNRPKKPFAVQWRVNKRPKTKSFSTQARQIAFAKELAGGAAEHWVAAYRLDESESREWRAFRAEVGQDVPLDSVLACWRKYGSAESAVSPVLNELIPRYLALRDDEKSWGADARRHAKKHLERFAKGFGSRRVITITREEIREFLFGRTGADGRRTGVLTGDGGEVIGPHGIKDHRKNISTFLQYCVRERWGVIGNECAYVKPPKIDDGDPVVIPLRDAFEFFKANRDERLIGRVALEAFGFIRHGTAGEITKDAIDFDRRGIRLAAGIHKTGKKDGRSRYRQGQPDNLWAWLEHAPDSCWDMTKLNYREAKRYAMIRAGLRPMENITDADAEKIKGLRNIWRHSAISYHLAAFNDPGKTQRLAQHASYSQTEEYEGLADRESGIRYSMITPQTVLLSWEGFLALPLLG